jgi:hypothetical protein
MSISNNYGQWDFLDGLTLTGESLNHNARIINRKTKNGKLRTETRYRDAGADRFAISTDKHDATKLFIDIDGGDARDGYSLTLTGRQARSLFRVLGKHFLYTNKSTNF